MNKYFFIMAILLSIPTTSSAGLFGPSNFDECIIESMQGVTSDAAALAVAAACRNKFPAKKHHSNSSEIPEAAVAEIDGNASMSSEGFFGGVVYNGNSDWHITQITITITPKTTQFDFTDPDVRQAYKNVFARENGYDLNDPDVNRLLDEHLDALMKTNLEQQKKYNVDVTIDPLTTKKFHIPALQKNGSSGQQFDWAITAAKGYKK